MTTDQTTRLLSICETLLNESVREYIERPPEIDREYANLESNKRLGWEAKEEIKAKIHKENEGYFDEKWAIEVHNRTLFTNLYEALRKEYYDSDDQKKKIIIKIFQVQRHIMGNPNPYRGLKLDFEKFKLLKGDKI